MKIIKVLKLDKYDVNCTEIMEEKEEVGKRIFIFEVEGEDIEAIKSIANLVGKRCNGGERLSIFCTS